MHKSFVCSFPFNPSLKPQAITNPLLRSLFDREPPFNLFIKLNLKERFILFQTVITIGSHPVLLIKFVPSKSPVARDTYSKFILWNPKGNDIVCFQNPKAACQMIKKSRKRTRNTSFNDLPICSNEPLIRVVITINSADLNF